MRNKSGDIKLLQLFFSRPTTTDSVATDDEMEFVDVKRRNK